MIGERLGAVYAKLEDKFYGMLDFMDAKGVPVYKAADFFDNKGIPAFPLTVAVVVVLLSLFFSSTILSSGVNPIITLNVVDEQGNRLDGTTIEILASEGRQWFGPEAVKSGYLAELENVPLKTMLTISASKEGYAKAEQSIEVTSELLSVNLFLQSEGDSSVIGKIRLVDYETNTPVDGVTVTGTWNSRIFYDESDFNGMIELTGVPLGEALLLELRHSNYEDKDTEATFYSNEVKEVSMSPKPALFEGKTSLVVNIYDIDTGELLDGTSIKLYNAETDYLIEDDDEVDNGVYTTSLPEGTIIKLVVEKENYVSFESKEWEYITLRGREVQEDIYMELGGESLLVSVVEADNSINAISNATVGLYSYDGSIIDSIETAFNGLARFEGLDPNETYYLGVFKQGFLPQRITVSVATSEEIIVELERENVQNSSTLKINVMTAQNKPAANASLKFWEISGVDYLPLGVPAQSTGLDGSHEVSLEVGRNVMVEAKKGVEEGRGEIEITGGTNSLLIELDVPLSVKKIIFTDELGNALTEGIVSITSKDGMELFAGEIGEEGFVLFDPLDNDYVQLKVELPDGKEYSEELMVKGQTDFEVSVKARKPTDLKPEIEFLGIFNLNGEKVEGITPDEEFILKFETGWVTGNYSGGVHVRLGADSIKYVDSQYVGATGFDAVASGHFYGRSYNAFPEPGNESVDRANKGEGGKLNKFVELYFNNPKGTKIVKVRIKARPTIKESEVELKYRAWAEIGGALHRSPEDKVLSFEEFNAEKSGLYAETLTKTIKVFESFPSCQEELCVSFNFVNDKEVVFGEEEFSAAKGKVYALEISAFSKADKQAQLKVSTSKQQPRIAFTGYEVSFFQDFIDNNATATDLDIKEVNLAQFTETKARAYFKANQTGSTYIKVQAVTDGETITEDLHFSIFEEKALELEVSPQTLLMGKDFTVTVKDSDGDSVEEAELKIFSPKGELLETIKGNGSSEKGRFGVYRVKNSFGLGRHLLEAEAEKFMPASLELMIGRENGLVLEKEVMVRIPAGQKKLQRKVEIENLTGEMITNLGFEVKKSKSFPHEFSIEASLPVVLEAGRKAVFDLTVNYGGETEQSIYGEAILEVSGLVNESFVAKGSTKIKASYNELLDSSCLEFDREELMEYLVGTEGNSKLIEFRMKNNCGQALSLNPEIIPRGTADPMIQVGAEPILLREGEEVKTRITVVNKIKRNFFREEKEKFDIIFHSPQLSKGMPLTVILWDQMFSLDVTPQIVMYLTQSVQEEPARAIWPIFVRNTGFGDIENITIAKFSDTAKGVTLRVLPDNSHPLLKQGMEMVPYKTLMAESTSNVNRQERATLQVNGVINGRQYTLRNIDIFINISAGLSCLEIYSDEDLRFTAQETGYGASKRTIYLKNRCLEAIRLQDVEPKSMQGNKISIHPIGLTLYPGQEGEFELIVEHSQDYMGPAEISVVGIGLNSRQWVKTPPLPIRIEIGKTAEACKGAEAGTCLVTGSVMLPVCGQENERKRVYFPRLATNDCSEGYCDAQKLAKFLMEEVQSKIRQIKARIGGSDVTKFGGCDQTKTNCNISRLGIKSESFDVFLSNDALGKEMVRNEIRKAFSDLKGYDVQIGDNRDIGDIVGAGIAKVLMIPSGFEGCGLYRVSISGAVQVIGKKFNLDNIGIKIELTAEKQSLPECNSRIQNLNNFLPKDETYTYLDSGGSWLGLVEPEDDDLNPLAESFAEGLFGKSDGRVLDNAPNNRMLLQTGLVEEDGLLKIAISKSGESNRPRTVYVTITNAFREAQSQQVQDNIASEAGEVIRELAGSHIEEGCISEDEDYLIVKSVGKAGEEKPFLEGPSSVKVGIDWVCNDFSIMQKKGSSETVKVRYYFPKGEELARGIEAVELRKKTEGNEIEVIGRDKEIPAHLFNDSEKGETLFYEFEVCVKGNKEMQFAQGKKISLAVKSTQRTTESIKELKISVCGITPEDLMIELKDLSYEEEKLDKEGDETNPNRNKWYATVGWAGGEDTVPLDAVKESVVENSKKIWGDKYKDKRRNGTYWYAGACAAACIPCTVIKGFGGGAAMILPACLGNCGLPVLVAFGQEYGWWSNIGNFVKGEFNDVKNFFKGEADDVLKGTVTTPKATDFDAGYDQFVDSGYRDLLASGTAGGSAVSGIRGLTTSGAYNLVESIPTVTSPLEQVAKSADLIRSTTLPPGFDKVLYKTDGSIGFMDSATGKILGQAEQIQVETATAKFTSAQAKALSADNAYTAHAGSRNADPAMLRSLERTKTAAARAETRQLNSLTRAKANAQMAQNNSNLAGSKIKTIESSLKVENYKIQGATEAELFEASAKKAHTSFSDNVKTLKKMKLDHATKGQLDDAINQMDDILKNNASLSSTNLDDLATLSKQAQIAVEASSEVRISGVGTAGKWKTFWGKHPKWSGFLRGMVCTATSQLAGTLAFAAYWDASGELGLLDEVQGGIMINGVCEADPNFVFTKNQTYEISMKVDSTGKRTILLCELEDLSEVDNSKRLDKCDGKFLKTSSPSADQVTGPIAKIMEVAEAKGFSDWETISAIAWKESSYRPEVVSEVGAVGMMQIMPPHFCDSGLETVKEFGQSGVECYEFFDGDTVDIPVKDKTTIKAVDVKAKGTGFGIPPEKWFEEEINIGMGIDVYAREHGRAKIAGCENRDALALAMYYGSPNAVTNDCGYNYPETEAYATAVISRREQGA